jgi:signal transduction histidine kinase
VAIDAQRM